MAFALVGSEKLLRNVAVRGWLSAGMVLLASAAALPPDCPAACLPLKSVIVSARQVHFPVAAPLPAGESAGPTTPTVVAVTWVLDENTGGVDPDGFSIYRSLSPATSSCLSLVDPDAPIAVLPDPNARLYLDRLPGNATSYSYRVVPWSDLGACLETNPIPPVTVSTCGASATPLDPPIQFPATGPVTCGGVRLSVETDEPVLWLRDDQVVSTVGDPSYSATTAGAYRALLASPNEGACPRATPAATVSAPPPAHTLQLSSPNGSVLCWGDKISVIVNYPIAQKAGDFSYTFQWYRDRVAISGATSAIHEPAVSGTYSVKVTGYHIEHLSAPGCVVMSADLPLTVKRVPGHRIERQGGNCYSSILGLRRVDFRASESADLYDFRWFTTILLDTQPLPSCSAFYPSSPMDPYPEGFTEITDCSGRPTCDSRILGRQRYFAVYKDRLAGCCGSTVVSAEITTGTIKPTILFDNQSSAVECTTAYLEAGPTSGAPEYSRYEWLEGEEYGSLVSIPDATDRTYTVAHSGTYRISAETSPGCPALSDPVSVFVTGQLIAQAANDVTVGLPVNPCPGGVCDEIRLDVENLVHTPSFGVIFDALDDYAVGSPTADTIVRRASVTSDGVRIVPDTLGVPGKATVFVKKPDFGRRVVARIYLSQATCENLSVTDQQGRPALYAAMPPGEVVTVPRAGTSYGGTPVRVFGKGIGDPATIDSLGITIGGMGTDLEPTGTLNEVIATTHARTPGSDRWTDVKACWSTGSCWNGADLFRFVDFGIVTLAENPQTGFTAGAYLFDASDLGALDFQLRGSGLFDADPYEKGPQPVFEGSEGIAGTVFGKNDVYSGAVGVPHHSWVYVAEPSRLVRYDLGTYLADRAYGTVFWLGDPIDTSYEVVYPVPPFCIPLRPRLTRHFLSIAGDREGRVSAIVTETSYSAPVQPGCSQRRRAVGIQLWNESGSLDEIDSTIPLHDIAQFQLYYPDDIWVARQPIVTSPTTGTTATGRILVSQLFVNPFVDPAEETFGIRAFEVGLEGCGIAPKPACPPLSELGAFWPYETPIAPSQQSLFPDRWPSSEMARLPVEADGVGAIPRTFVLFFDPEAKRLRQFDLGLNDGGGGLRPGFDLAINSVLSDMDVAAPIGGTFTKTDGIRVFLVGGEGALAGQVSKIFLKEDGLPPIIQPSAEQYGPTTIKVGASIRAVAVSESGRPYGIAALNDRLVAFDLKSLALDPRISERAMPSQPLDVKLQDPLTMSTLTEAATAAIEHLPDQAWAALERRAEILADLAALQAAFADGSLPVTSLVGRTRAIEAKVEKYLLDRRGRTVLKDHATTMRDVIDRDRGSSNGQGEGNANAK